MIERHKWLLAAAGGTTATILAVVLVSIRNPPDVNTSVPSVLGLRYDVAAQKLAEARLCPVPAGNVPLSHTPPATVVAQEPVPKTVVPLFSTVQVEASEGWERLRTLADAALNEECRHP